MRRLRFACLLAAAVLLAAVARADEVVLLAEEGEDVRALVETLRLSVPPRLGLVVQRAGEPLAPRCATTRLWLTRGERSARAVLQACPQGRVWALEIPGVVLDALRADSGGRLSGVAAEPAVERQVTALEALRPRPRQVAIPYSPQAAGLARAAAQSLAARGFQPLLLPSDPQGQPLRPLREVLGEVQAVLALPDPALYHESLLKHWLLMTARERVPMIGGLGAQDVRRGVAIAAVLAEGAAWALTLQLMPELLGPAPLPAVRTLEQTRQVYNPLILERLGLRLELE